MSRIIETLGPPPDWMMGAAKRTDNFFKRVPVSNQAGSSAAPVAADNPGHLAAAGDGAQAPEVAAAAAAAAGTPRAYEYVLYTKEEFETVNKCQVGSFLHQAGRPGKCSTCTPTCCTVHNLSQHCCANSLHV